MNMSAENDMPFVNKKVDESWKEQAEKEKVVLEQKRPQPQSASGDSKPSQATETSKPFINLLTSLGYQAMMHLGEIPHPHTGESDENLEAAKETIDLLVSVRTKTEGRLSPEETELIKGLIPELQMKYAQKA